MKRLSWYSLPILLVLLLFCIGKCVAQEAAFHADQVVIQDDQREHSAEEKAHTSQDGTKAPPQHESVQEALRILRNIRPPMVSKLARYTRKPKGFLGSTIYYAKEAFTLLFLTSPIKTSPVAASMTSTLPPQLPSSLAEAVTLLEDAATTAQDPSDALFLLAELNFHGNFSHPISYPRAFNYYKQLADITGNSTAQHMVGFIYATGLNPEVGQDHAKSMLYHTFAAEQDDTRSEMTVAYRRHAGISTPRNCEEAVILYQRVARKAIAYYQSGPPGGHNLNRDAYRLADEAGGVYGPGASYSSAGHNAKNAHPSSNAYADIDDVLEYLLFQSSKGDIKATFGLGRLYYDGERNFKRDLRTAKKYFMEVARQYWDASGKIKNDANADFASKAAGYLGLMFLRGEGMDQSLPKAKIWFQRGVSNGDAISQYSLGLMYLEGLGVEQNIAKAVDYFAAAADQDLALAQTRLGVLFLDEGDDITTAIKYFELAARNHHIEAFFYLAEIADQGIGRERSCSTAAHFYKIVAEKAEPLWASLEEANEAYEEGDTHKALIGYLMAAEQGSENAQANVAWILDETRPKWSLLVWFTTAANTISKLADAPRLALRYWTRSAKQGNYDSIVKMGDYYLTGLGVATVGHSLLPQPDNAAACYQAAAETLQSAQAMWNLGWMHENGLGGVEQDFHLAKRFYDQALETNKEAYLPVKLSLFKLRWRSWWNKVTYGSVKSIQDEESPRTRRTFLEWLVEFLEADARMNYDQHDGYEADDWDSAREPMPGGDEYWNPADEYDDDLVITLIIAGLIGVLLWLFWYRQQQQRALERRRREAVQQNADGNVNIAAEQQHDRGVFPPPGDPAWNQWVAGGVGH
ncbi:hypothetical protein AMS68_003625 [Peltaster fructicola]|uniref:Uncharacterized protein n=1 Tax=Peltaster fructicola TaxID=286661 RepID=A0A6H0XU18_9PEZI|nr:hypothetical protein AMS68_003625 [Peltaster fructicola]